MTIELTNDPDQPIGMDFRPDKTVRQLVEALASVVEEKHGVDNGTTALYWALMATVARHATRKEP